MMKRPRQEEGGWEDVFSQQRSSISNIIKKIVKKDEDMDSLSDYEEEIAITSNNSKMKQSEYNCKSKSKALNEMLHDDQDTQYLFPKWNKDKRSLIASKKNLVRKLVSLVKPTTKKMHVGLWKYVIAVNKRRFYLGFYFTKFVYRKSKGKSQSLYFKRCTNIYMRKGI